MTRLYDLGPFRLDVMIGAVTRAGMPTALGARAVAVLTVLVEHAHEFVSKRGLIDAAWPDVIVEESNLAVQIHAIRRVLSEAPGGEHWVETLAKRGYRFVGPVTALPNPGGRDSARSNLPEPVTSFVGRERDLLEIKRLLPTKRLVTLVGVGGIGKTRLALQIAGEVIDAYRDGVWFVELGSLRDPALVPASLAQVLGVPERAGKPLTDALCAHLRKLQVLLILDNCEHLLSAGARLVDEARLWLWSGLSAVSASPGRAIAAFERAIRLYRKLDHPLELGLADAWLAAALAIAGQFDQARAALAEAFQSIENCGIPKVLAFYHGSVAVLEVLSGNPASARTHFERALSLFREAGSDNNALDSIINLASVSWALGDLAAAEKSLREYIAMRGKPYVRRTGLGGALGNLAGVLAERGQLAEALAAAREALPLLADGVTPGVSWTTSPCGRLSPASTGMPPSSRAIPMLPMRQGRRHAHPTKRVRVTGYAHFCAKRFCRRSSNAPSPKARR
jgi:DNA-binding winged helix-turn-helix (wHTH) protein/tetratricopeptide (TPR) repeat protein